MLSVGACLHLLNCLLTDGHEGVLQGSSVNMQNGNAGACWQLVQACSPLCLPHQVAAQLLEAPAETKTTHHRHGWYSTMRIPIRGLPMLVLWGAYPMTWSFHGYPDPQSACNNPIARVLDAE